MVCRERQTAWLAELIEDQASYTEEFGKSHAPVEIMGKAYKPETNLTVGSPAALLGTILQENGVAFTHTDPYVEEA